MGNIEFLQKSLPFWNNLTAKEKELIINNYTIIEYKKHANIHNASNNCLGLLIVKKGILRTYILSDQGKEITLYRISSGELCILSASCVLQNITFDVFIDAEEDCEVLQISASCFSAVTQSNIYAECFAYKIITERFSDVMWAMQQILFMSFDSRLATFLIEESSKTNCDTISLTHEQIAKYIGSAREVVTRMLKYFADENMVSLSRGKIKILNKNKLKDII